MRPLDLYPNPIGARVVSVFPHVGPTVYTAVTPGVAPANATGGDPVNASEAGLKTFDVLIGGLTDSGVYRVETIPTSPSGAVAAPNAVYGGATTYILRWVVVATGAEAGAIDLDAEIVRLTAIGGY